MRSLRPAAVSFPPSKQRYESLPTALLLDIFARLPFKQKMTCEAVCSGWRNVLRCPPFSNPRQPCDPSTAGVWGALVIYLQYCCPGITHHYTLVQEESWDKTNIILPGPSDPFEQPDAGFAAWLRLRAAGALEIKLSDKAEKSAWAFSDLVLAICDSCRFLPAMPPLTVVTGTSCFRHCR